MSISPQRWSLAIRLFHWSTLLLVVLAWWTMEMRHDFPKGSAERGVWMSWHISVGVLLWLITLMRLLWRSVSVAPALEISDWQKKLSRLVQASLYGILLAMPVCGALARQLGGKGMLIANRWQLPLPVGNQDALAHWFAEFHEDVLWPALLVLVAVHAGAALLHHFYWRDNTLRSMLR